MAPYVPSHDIPGTPAWIRYCPIEKALQEKQQTETNGQLSIPTPSPGGLPGASATKSLHISKSTQTTPSLRRTSKSEDACFDIESSFAEDKDTYTALALLQTPTRSRCRLVTESSSSGNEDYSQLIPSAYPEEHTQPTTPLLKPLAYEARFSDLYPPAQRPRRLPSSSPCPPGRYSPSSPPRPTQALEPLEFDYPSSDFELECPSPDVEDN